MFSRPRSAPVRLIAASVATATLLTACGVDPASPPASTSTPGPSASEASTAPTSASSFLIAVNDRLLAQTGSMTTTASPTSTTVTTRSGDDLMVATQGGASTSTVVVVAGEVWAKADNLFWRLSVTNDDPSVVAGLVGRWVLVTGTQIARNYDREPDLVFRHPDDTTKTGTDTVDGVPVDVYDDPVAAATIYLSTGDEPLPVRVEQLDSTVITFTGFGTSPTIEPPTPSEVVDGRDLVR